jgi:hypothetical protein
MAIGKLARRARLMYIYHCKMSRFPLTLSKECRVVGVQKIPCNWGPGPTQNHKIQVFSFVIGVTQGHPYFAESNKIFIPEPKESYIVYFGFA